MLPKLGFLSSGHVPNWKEHEANKGRRYRQRQIERSTRFCEAPKKQGGSDQGARAGRGTQLLVHYSALDPRPFPVIK
jgi:hypothetical protein